MHILKMKGHTRTDSMHEVKSMYIYIHPHSTFYSTSLENKS